MLWDPSFVGGDYALWFTNPVCFVLGGQNPFQYGVQWSASMHEMGHNFTLNTPADFYYGGKIDGNGNAIYSESMDRIFQYATAYEIINGYEYYGLGQDLMTEIKQSTVGYFMGDTRAAYETYLNSGKPFSSWNDPSTPSVDETLGTFTTIAYKFVEHAENERVGCRVPLKRMLTLLQTFNQNLAVQYDPSHNTSSAAECRATLMVTALSYAFDKDFREEFRSLNFPINDHIFSDLYSNLSPVIKVRSGVTDGTYLTMQSAYDQCAANDIIEMQSTALMENPNFNKNIPITLQGGFNSNYSSQIDYTIIRSSIKISNGTVTVGNVIVQ